MSTIIRAATSADVPLILTFIRHLAQFENLSDQVEATEARLLTTLFPEKATPHAECVLAFAGEQPAGFAIFFTNYSTFLAAPGIHLEDLFVEPTLRRQGIGQALLRHLGALAAARGCLRIEWLVLDWNLPALNFYRALGAQPLREWHLCRIDGSALAALNQEFTL